MESMTVHELSFSDEIAVLHHKWRIGEYDEVDVEDDEYQTEYDGYGSSNSGPEEQAEDLES
jgi:hypothetical protein